MKILIQGYHKEAAKITANCSFCNLRVNLPKQKRPDGITFELKIPFTMWALDYVILDSRWQKPAALTLVDPFSGYTIYIFCSDKITDVELIKLLYERVFGYFGIPCALCMDQQSQMSSGRINTLCKMLRIKKFVSLAGRQNASERQHKLLLSVFAAINKKKLVSEQNAGFICAMATLLVNSTSVGPHNFSPNFLVFNGFNKKYASNRLFPFAGELSSEKFGITLRDVQQMSQIFKQIQEITRQRNLRKLPQLDKYMKKIKKVIFV